MLDWSVGLTDMVDRWTAGGRLSRCESGRERAGRRGYVFWDSLHSGIIPPTAYPTPHPPRDAPIRA